MNYTATYERIRSKVGIVELTNETGQWAGSFLVDYAHRSDLYELAYNRASAESAIKGGDLVRFSKIEAPVPSVHPFAAMAAECPHRREIALERRPCNGLNVEIGQAADRCTQRPPSDWLAGGVIRWIGSGGSLLVFGACRAAGCPLKKE